MFGHKMDPRKGFWPVFGWMWKVRTTPILEIRFNPLPSVWLSGCLCRDSWLCVHWLATHDVRRLPVPDVGRNNWHHDGSIQHSLHSSIFLCPALPNPRKLFSNRKLNHESLLWVIYKIFHIKKWRKMTQAIYPTLHPYNKAADSLLFSGDSSPSSSSNQLPSYEHATQDNQNNVTLWLQ